MRQDAWTRTLVIFGVIILGGIIVAGLGWMLLRVGGIVLVFLLGGLLAFALMPLVDLLDRPPVPRPVAVGISYMLVAIVLGGIGFLVFPPLVDQLTQLVQRLPEAANHAQSVSSQLSTPTHLFGISIDLSQVTGNLTSQLQTLGEAVLSNIVGIAKQVTSTLVDLVVVLVIAFYLLNEGHGLVEHLNTRVPASQRRKVLFFEDSVDRVLGGYIRGQLCWQALWQS